MLCFCEANRIYSENMKPLMYTQVGVVLYTLFSGFVVLISTHCSAGFCLFVFLVKKRAHFTLGFFFPLILFQFSISYCLFSNRDMFSVHFGASWGSLKMLSVAQLTVFIANLVVTSSVTSSVRFRVPVSPKILFFLPLPVSPNKIALYILIIK